MNIKLSESIRFLIALELAELSSMMSKKIDAIVSQAKIIGFPKSITEQLKSFQDVMFDSFEISGLFENEKEFTAFVLKTVVVFLKYSKTIYANILKEHEMFNDAFTDISLDEMGMNDAFVTRRCDLKMKHCDSLIKKIDSALSKNEKL